LIIEIKITDLAIDFNRAAEDARGRIGRKEITR
jgi:hypothetical protein